MDGCPNLAFWSHMEIYISRWHTAGADGIEQVKRICLVAIHGASDLTHFLAFPQSTAGRVPQLYSVIYRHPAVWLVAATKLFTLRRSDRVKWHVSSRWETDNLMARIALGVARVSSFFLGRIWVDEHPIASMGVFIF